MTHENQALHEEVLQWQQKTAGLHRAVQNGEKRTEEEAVGARRIMAERDDVLRMYRQLSQEKDRVAAALQSLSAERDSLLVTREDIRSQLNASRQEAEQTLQLVNTRELDVSSLKQQLGDVSARLDATALSAASAENSRGDVRQLASALHRSDETRHSFERTVTLVQAQNNALVEKLQVAERDRAQFRSEIAAERSRSLGLEGVIADLRVQRPTAAESLQRTVSQQYELIGQMDAEIQRLKRQLGETSPPLSQAAVSAARSATQSPARSTQTSPAASVPRSAPSPPRTAGAEVG